MSILPGVAKGELILAVALQEGPRFQPYAIETKAEVGDGYRLSGEKSFVLDGHVADYLVVAARTSGASGERAGISLFLVDPKSDGVEVTRTLMVDSHNAARVKLTGVAKPITLNT